jgi:hypothetical protein
MDVKTSQLKNIVILFVLFVVIGSGIAIRSSHLANASNRKCDPVSAVSSFEQQVDAIALDAMQEKLGCDKQ